MAEVKTINDILAETFQNIVHDIKGPVKKDVFSLTESPIEEVFALGIRKFLAPKVEFIPQHWINTPQGNFRLDFLLKRPGVKSICIECDGKEFHNMIQDCIRDVLILKNSDIDEIIRINGFGINFALESCLYFIFKCHPDLLKEDMIQGIESFLSERIMENIEYVTHSELGGEESPFEWGINEDYQISTPVRIFRRKKKYIINPIGFYVFKDIMNFIDENKSLKFDQLYENYIQKFKK